MSGSLAYNSTTDGIFLSTLSGIVALDDVIAIDNGAGGIVMYCTPGVEFDRVIANRNGDSGLHVWGVSPLMVDIDSGSEFNGNGKYGIEIDENTGGHYSTGSMINATGDITVENNTLGGIIAYNHSIVVLTNVDGTNTGAYGLELQTGSYATITTDTGITGATGDATITDGSIPLTWATDFASDGDTETNLTNGCRIERRD